MKLRNAFALLGIALFGMSALADEGMLEINQVCAVNTGCFAGDSPGFPVTIMNPGSYRLTSNLDVTVASNPSNTNGLQVDIDDVHIDLNGFAIRGPVSCTGFVAVSSCEDTGNGDGISARFAENVTVSNGTVSNMGATGVDIGDQGHVIAVHAEENGSDGIRLGPNGLVEKSSAKRNLEKGIAGSLSGGSVTTVIDSVARANGNDGIGGFRGKIVNCTADSNGDDGIDLAHNSLVLDSTAMFNTAGGMDINHGSLVRGSTASSNGVNGIFLRGGDSLVVDSSTIGNGDDGIDCDMGTSGIKGNVLTGNTAMQFRGCVTLGDNICNGSICP